MLADLIETHKNAMAQFEEACEVLEDIADAYDAAETGNEVKIKLYDIMATVHDNGEWLRDYANEIICKCSKQLPFIREQSPEFADQFTDFLAETQTALHLKIEEALAEDERRRDVFGLTAARKRWDDKNTAETEALNAICRYRCANHDEERERLRYILECPSAMGCAGSFDDFANLMLEAVR